MYDKIVLSFTAVGFQIIAYRTKKCKNIELSNCRTHNRTWIN